MNLVSSLANRAHCSSNQVLDHFVSIRSMDEGLTLIDLILGQSVLCSHDVDLLNRTFVLMDRLEREGSIEEGGGTLSALTKVIEKIKAIAKNKLLLENNIVTLYHLQKFKEGKLFTTAHFKEVNAYVKKDQLAIAQALPNCSSIEQFNEAVQQLIGTPTKEAEQVLDRKREELQKKAESQEWIREKKADLDNRRRASPDGYPPYFDELIEGGFTHLYDHLMMMKGIDTHSERKEKIAQMEFHEAAHVILETRDSIIRKVKNFLTKSGSRATGFFVRSKRWWKIDNLLLFTWRSNGIGGRGNIQIAK